MTGELRVIPSGDEAIVELPQSPFLRSSPPWPLMWDIDPSDPQAPKGSPAMGGGRPGGSPDSTVLLSEPIVAALSPEDVEGHLRAFVRDQAASFAVVHISCGFRPARKEQIHAATLDVLLWGRRDGGLTPGDDAPIAWSLDPTRRTTRTDDTTTVRIGMNLKFAEAAVEHAHQARAEVAVQGRGELTSQPSWLIRRTDAYELHGDERFVLLVRAQRDTEVGGRFTLTSELSRRGLMVRTRFRSMQTQELNGWGSQAGGGNPWWDGSEIATHTLNEQWMKAARE